MKRVELAAISVVILVLSSAHSAVPAVGSAACKAPPPAPWTDASVQPDQVPDLYPLMGKINDAFSGRVTEHWWAEPSGQLTLNIGIQDATVDDIASVVRLAGGSLSIDDLPIDVVSTPLSGQQLDDFQSKLTDFASSQNLPVSIDARPDVGVVQVVTTGKAVGQIEQFAAGIAPPCAIQVGPGDSTATLAVSRTDMPPYKVGKVVNVHIVNSTIARCSSGFILELNGSGQQPLYGTTAGHCAGQNLPNPVTDGLAGAAGQAVGPNLLRTTTDADAILINTHFSRVDMQKMIIVDSNTQRMVTSKIPPPQLGLGDSICQSGSQEASEVCAGLTSNNRTVTICVPDYVGFGCTDKNVNYFICFNGSLVDGDSGTGIYAHTGSGQAGAIALLMGASSNGDVCGSAIGHVTADTGTHVWLTG